MIPGKFEKVEKFDLTEFSKIISIKENYNQNIYENNIERNFGNNLGINYSLCSHIDNIKNNGYVELVIENEKRKLKPTQIGKRIINILEKEKQEFIKPEIRKEAEKLLLTLAFKADSL